MGYFWTGNNNNSKKSNKSVNCDVQLSNNESYAIKHEINKNEDKMTEGGTKVRTEDLKNIYEVEAIIQSEEESEIDFSNECYDFSTSTSSKCKK